MFLIVQYVKMKILLLLNNKNKLKNFLKTKNVRKYINYNYYLTYNLKYIKFN